MRALRASLVLTAAAAAMGAGVACRSPGASPLPEARADEPARAGSGAAAVVELFTSEGCSSCPPADEVLTDLARARGPDGPIYALAFHVDYWDELGWPDRFASPSNTARQRAYARAFGAHGLYTPQLVVGGTEEFNGSDRGHASEAVARALARPSGVRLSLHPRPGGGVGSVAVDYDAAGAPAGSVIVVALVERAASTDVRAGENAGRTLRHANVVRGFASAQLSGGGSLEVRAVPPLRREDGEVIAYVQRASGAGGGMPVVGAARAPLP